MSLTRMKAGKTKSRRHWAPLPNLGPDSVKKWQLVVGVYLSAAVLASSDLMRGHQRASALTRRDGSEIVCLS